MTKISGTVDLISYLLDATYLVLLMLNNTILLFYLILRDISYLIFKNIQFTSKNFKEFSFIAVPISHYFNLYPISLINAFIQVSHTDFVS